MVNIGCSKCDDDCPDEQKIFGNCWQEKRELYLFSGFPEFYCYNDSIAVGYPVEEIDSPTIYIRSYQYLENQGSKENWIITGTLTSNGRGEFKEVCYNAPDKAITYYTFLVVEDYNNVGADTKELHCKLELRENLYGEQDDPNLPPNKVLDSSTIILKRVN